ncbi:MAG: bifunctional indole-3-glycerol-phosphate synthase TrpC/phosphoribosylanthranilate isomerase TrpF [Pseudomonadota bacterium]|nr:bifunctional indole-3-glycerol-phosphate synthase TrpC/phosphoribosylanthranilate isomerase TrpF [Pseudomonadota bacterium]
MAEGILGEIAAAKRAELAQRFANLSIEALRQQAVRTGRSLAAAIARPGSRFILEIKKASPSAGAIRGDADVAAIARGYAGVADALSVLTDGYRFGGSLDDVRTARAQFDGPILAKDFFLDPRQVVEARIAGADAVLVMLSLLENDAAREMIDEARRLGMDALVEAHDEQEMRRAIALGARLIGINNRDLRDLSIDLATTERLARLAPERLLVSESGIGSRADVERLAPQVDGFLVGSSLMRAQDPAQAARALVFGRVKLCGLNRSEDIAAGAAAAFAGFVFVPGSPRHLSVEQAAPLAEQAQRRGILPVGVFRDSPLAVAADIATLLNLHAVQLHGREDEDYVNALRRQLPAHCELWTAVSVGRDPLDRSGGNRLLFDNGDGGSGRNFDWQLVRNHPRLQESLVAGGIGAANARQAAALGAYAIDAGSALDAAPGLKSAIAIRGLFEALRPQSRTELRACA